MYDAVIIGAGVTGSAIARELSRYEGRFAVLEKEEDVCCGTSKANSGIVHAGHDALPGSMKARMNVRGNQLMEELSKELDFPFRRNGSVVLCFEEADIPKLERLKLQGEENGVQGLEIITGERMKEVEPAIADSVKALLYAPTGGIVCPFKLNIALAENACVNGVEFYFNTQVKNILPMEQGYRIETSQGYWKTKSLINAAGVYADELNNMVSSRKLHITPRRGEYILMDKKAGQFVEKTVFQLPTALGKGVLITPTIHGNLMIGPTAQDIMDREGINTTAKGMDEVVTKAGISAPGIPIRQAITSFAGLRAHEAGDDFVLGETEDAPGFFNAAGIESPGLTSAPAIGELLSKLVADWLGAKKKKDFIAVRKDLLRFTNLEWEAAQKLIAENPAYGNVVCRCETVTEGEILDAIHRPLGAKSLDGVKRRTRAGMGRCQAGFCGPKVMEILSRELKIPLSDITKSGGESKLLLGQKWIENINFADTRRNGYGI